MGTTNYSIILRGIFYFIILVFFPALLTAQGVIIKENIQINPKARIINKAALSSYIPCFEGSILQGKENQSIHVLRPCRIDGTGSFTPANTVPVAIYLSNVNLTNKTDYILGGCGEWVGYGLWNFYTCGGFNNVIVTGIITGNQATININADWNCQAGNVVPIAASIALSATPDQNPDTCMMSAAPIILNSSDYDLESHINATICDNTGHPFQYCDSASMVFTIENPIEGVKLYAVRNDGKRIEGNSIEVECYNSSAGVTLAWDASNCRKDIDTLIRVQAQALSASGVQTVELINIIPDHFTVTPDADTIYAGESVNVLAIAKDSKDEEEPLDEQTLVTYLDISEEGSFIVDSDTTFQQVTVPYGKAQSGEVKYYAPDNASGDVSPKEALIFVYRAEHPERYGFEYIEVITSCPVVHISKTEISPGDTAVVSIIARKRDGTELPYPPDQMFNLWMNTDEKYGRLRCISTGEEGSYLYGPQPFEFIAADSIDVNATVVEIEANVSTGGGGASSITSGTKDTLSVYVEAIMANAQMKAKNIGAVPNEMKRKNIELSINKLQAQLNKLVVKKGNEKHKQKLAIGIEQLKARLWKSIPSGAYETAKNPTEEKNALANMKQAAMLASEAVECKSTAEITIKKEEECPVVSITPTKIKSGESATITMKKQKSDGTLVDFPAGQTFDIAIEGDGGKYGDLVDGQGNQATRFPNVTVPVTFKAYKDIFNEVTITINGKPIGGVPANCENPTAKLTVEDGCSSIPPSAPRCSSVANDPSVSVVSNPNGFGGVVGEACSDPQTKGFFKPMPSNNADAFQPPVINACYDETARVWKITVPEMTINVVLDLCEQNLQGFGIILVSDLASLPADDICDPKLEQDLKAHYTYPLTPDMYYFGEVLMLHEASHALKYETRMLPFKSALNEKLNSIDVFCRNAQTAEQAQQSAEPEVRSAIRGFVEQANIDWDAYIGAKGSLEREAMEQKNHKNVAFLIYYMLKTQLPALKVQYGCK